MISAPDAPGSVGRVSDQVMPGALNYQRQAPLGQSLLQAAGIKPDDVPGDLKP